MTKEISNLLLSILAFFPLQATAQEKVDMSKPPYWVSSHHELDLMRKEQKAIYIGKLVPEFEKVPALKTINKDKLLEASKNNEAWDELRLKVFTYCADKSVVKTCDGLSAIRTQVLLMGSARGR